MTLLVRGYGRQNSKMAPMTFASWCYCLDFVTGHGNRDFADVVEVPNQMTLKLGDSPVLGFNGREFSPSGGKRRRQRD